MTHQELAVKIRSTFAPTTVETDILSAGIKSSFGVRIDGGSFLIEVVEVVFNDNDPGEAQR